MKEEKLSDLVDGEFDLSELDEILAEFESDRALRRRYSRLRLARDSRRGVQIRDPNLDFADGVMAALDRDSARDAQRGWMTGFAFAATVTAAAVLVLRPTPPTAPAPDTVAQAPPAVSADAGRPWSALDAFTTRELERHVLAYRRQHAAGAAGRMQRVTYMTESAEGTEPMAADPAPKGRR
jgi:negative regulator of sigma E activity